MIYKVECPNCGFEYSLATNDAEIVEELKQCPCGHEANVEVQNGKE
jgi:hypothetical protein